MAKLTIAQRARIPSRKFACPRIRAYPIHDIERIVNARSRTKAFGQKCKGQKRKICTAARKRGLLKPAYAGFKGWRQFCRRV